MMHTDTIPCFVWVLMMITNDLEASWSDYRYANRELTDCFASILLDVYARVCNVSEVCTNIAARRLWMCRRTGETGAVAERMAGGMQDMADTVEEV